MNDINSFKFFYMFSEIVYQTKIMIFFIDVIVSLRLSL